MMEQHDYSLGRRPGNPLSRRVWKDLCRDWKRYLMIFIMMTATIGFVSGMYVANNSMLTSLKNGVETYRREDGHFLLSGKADPKTISAIRSGELADVAAVFRERAYEEAEDEVRRAVEDAVTESVREQVREVIRLQAESAVREELAAAEAMGAEFSDGERQSAIDEAVKTALAENYDKAFEGALDAALNSEEYETALSDAREEARKEIDERINEEYEELADRYELGEAFEAVPVEIYELFYKEETETIPGDSDYSGSIRVYQERGEIDLYDLIEGRTPQTDSEIIIDRMHADNVNVRVGDTLKVGGTEFQVVGLAAFVDYTTLYENNTDTMFDALTFDVAMTTDEGFERIHSNTCANYAFTYQTPPADLFEEKELAEDFLKALITQVAVAENEDLEIKDYVPAYVNQAMIFAPEDMGSDKAMGGVLLYILIVALAFIFAISISAALEQEASVIGTLRASGYTRAELLRYYMTAPLLTVLVAAIAGNILGYTVFKKTVVGMYYNSYSLPTYETLWTPQAFLNTTIIPIVLMTLINLIVISRKLRLSPLRFLRHDLKQSRRRKAVRLPKWKFFSRFRIRVLLQNIPNYLMLFVGITFVMVLLSMAVGMPTTLRYYQESFLDMMFAEQQVILSSTEDEDGNVIQTQTPGAEPFSLTSLERRSDVYDEEVSVYGVSEESNYIHLSDAYYQSVDDDGETSVSISKAYAEKYGVRVGDDIVLSEKYEHRDYTWRVTDIYDYAGGIAVFMTNAQFNAVFDKEEGSFSGYLSHDPVTDIEEAYIAKVITAEDLTKLARQLDHSMGAYMLYFQYVCVIVAAIILYLLTKIIIEKNERAISMVKILGYENAEIASLYLVPTAVVVFLSEFLAIYLGFQIMSTFWKSMMMELGGWFAFVMTPAGFLREFVLVFIAYLVISIVDFARIRRIPKVLALKNME